MKSHESHRRNRGLIRVLQLLFRRALAFFTVCCWCGVFFCSACGESGAEPPKRELLERDVSGGLHDTLPVHHVAELLIIHRDGEAYTCSMCHSYFSENNRDKALAGEHSDIHFDHGRNVLCMNCHHPREPDLFVAHGGEPIPKDEPTELCSKCHGPHYREWSMGVHGRINGYWNPEMGEQKRLDCIQCHDPHRPKFPKMSADPPPPPSLTRFRDERADAHNQNEGERHE